MFFVKTKISEGVTLNAGINDENVCTRCPDCGCEHAVDLVEIVKDGGDLYATAVRCPDCTQKHLGQSADG